MKVMVVEDSAAMRGLIASVLGQITGCEVLEVSTGFEALRQLPRSAVDLIVTDINMPDINGLELLAFVRRSPALAKVPVLVVTSESSDRDKEKALALGANAYLVKPFDAEGLLDAVRGLLPKGF